MDRKIAKNGEIPRDSIGKLQECDIKFLVLKVSMALNNVYVNN